MRGFGGSDDSADSRKADVALKLRGELGNHLGQPLVKWRFGGGLIQELGGTRIGCTHKYEESGADIESSIDKGR
jgi:hypothetical protein